MNQARQLAGILVTCIISASLVLAMQGKTYAANQLPYYYLPWAGGVAHVVSQGNNGSFSHTGIARYAWDFAGDAWVVEAARAGTVTAFKDSYGTGGCSTAYENMANYVTVRTSGYDALYLHLAKGSASGRVSLNKSVAAGDSLALTDSSGYVCGNPSAHLHFMVMQPCAAVWWCQSVPSSFLDADVLRQDSSGVPLVNQSVISSNYGGASGSTVHSLAAGAITWQDSSGTYQHQAAFFVGSNGSAYIDAWSQSTGNWQWNGLGTYPGVTLAGGGGAITWPDTSGTYQHQEAFFIGVDGSAYIDWWNQSINNWQWNGLGTYPGVRMVGGAGATTWRDSSGTYQHQAVFFVGSDGNAYVDAWNQALGNWQWNSLGRPATLAAGAGAIAWLDSSGTYENQAVFFVGADGNEYVDQWNQAIGNWQWSLGATNPGVPVVGGAGAETWPDSSGTYQRQAGFFVGSDGRAYVYAWNQAGQYFQWNGLGSYPGATMIGGSGAISWPDGTGSYQHQVVFFIGADGNAYIDWWNQSIGNWQWNGLGSYPGVTLVG
jgi:hypothetical protein